MSDWQPIETAPKDGTQIVLAIFFSTDNIELTEPGYQCGAWRDGKFQVEIGFALAGVASLGVSFECPWTHWMPLPTPPEQEGE